MSSNPISRATLQGMPEKTRQLIIHTIVDNTVSLIQHAANAGMTSYTHDPVQDIERYKSRSITTHDLVAAFKQKYPDCDVYYEETWVEVNSANKVLKKGIVINWS